MGIPGKQYYTIEQHGNKNEYALYFGRDGGRHGLNLCKLSDFDYNGAETRQKICNALNNSDIKKEDVMDKQVKVKAGFSRRMYDDNDFLLYPVLAVAHIETRYGKSWGIGIKFGYWGVYVGVHQLKEQVE